MVNAATDKVIEPQLKSEADGGQEAIEAERENEPIQRHLTLGFQVSRPIK